MGMGTDTLLLATPPLLHSRAPTASSSSHTDSSATLNEFLLPTQEPLADWITCAADLEPVPAATMKPRARGGRRTSEGSSSCLRTSMEIFMRHVQERADGSMDASGIMSKTCFAEWVASRKNKLKNPHLTFVHTVRSHVTGERKTGRNPFPAKVEADLLTLFRQRRVWPCFEGSGVKYGIRGMFVTGYHEGRGTLHPSLDSGALSGTYKRAVPSSVSSSAAASSGGQSTPRLTRQQRYEQKQQRQQGQDVSPFSTLPLLESLNTSAANGAPPPPLAFAQPPLPPPAPAAPVKQEIGTERAVSWQTMPAAMTEPRVVPPHMLENLGRVARGAFLPGLEPLQLSSSAPGAFMQRQTSLGLMPPVNADAEPRRGDAMGAEELMELLSDEEEAGSPVQQQAKRGMDGLTQPETKMRRLSL